MASPERVTIIHHPDVRRMLLTMKALTEAVRALAYVAMGSQDHIHHGTDESDRKAARAAPLTIGVSSAIGESGAPASCGGRGQRRLSAREVADSPFHAEQILARAQMHRDAVLAGSRTMMALDRRISAFKGSSINSSEDTQP